MRVPHEQEAGSNRDFPEPEMTASFHHDNSMQDSSRSPAREITEETDISTPTVSVEDVSDDRSSSRSESQITLRERVANLALSTPDLPRSPSVVITPDNPLPSVEVAECPTNGDPVTVRDLPNATPRHSRSPEPYYRPGPSGYANGPRSTMETADDEPNNPSTEGEDESIVP